KQFALCLRAGKSCPTVADGIGLLVSTYPHGGESLYSVAALCFLRHASDLSGGVFPLFCR
ncbi:hypothetical protein, partial [Phocaeicola massiliensis]|uniref:hypothetical protein n=1 Tax=Phocaeicola massiliensis TaxID=204516 RepID=UPI001C88C712